MNSLLWSAAVAKVIRILTVACCAIQSHSIKRKLEDIVLYCQEAAKRNRKDTEMIERGDER